MRIEEFMKTVDQITIADGKSVKIAVVKEADVTADERSKIIQQLDTGDFSDIVHEHEIRKGLTYGLYYQRLVTGRNQNGDRVTLAKLKFPTFDLETEDGSIAIRQGKIS